MFMYAWIYFIGLMFLADAMGRIYGSVYEFLILGVGLIVLGIIGMILKYHKRG